MLEQLLGLADQSLELVGFVHGRGESLERHDARIELLPQKWTLYSVETYEVGDAVSGHTQGINDPPIQMDALCLSSV